MHVISYFTFDIILVYQYIIEIYSKEQLTVIDPVMWNTVPVASDKISNQLLKVRDEKKQNIEFSLSATVWAES